MQEETMRTDIPACIRVSVPEAYERDRAMLQTLMERMMLARKFEEKVHWLFARGEILGTTHLAVGEEAATIGSTFAMRSDDYMMATHRGHCPAIGKGCDVNALMAELLAREAGCSGGRGGSMHFVDVERGVLGTNGIVGANAPLICGAAFTCKYRGLDRVSFAFTGDGSANEGAIMESFNLAAAWRLPVIFLIIDNAYGMSTPLCRASHDADLTKRGIPFGIRTYEADGNDVLAVYETVRQARAYTASGNGPCIVVEHTYRISGHSKSDANLYRTEEEIASWKARCPIKLFSEKLRSLGAFSEREIESMDARAAERVEAAVSYARSCPFPDPDDVLKNVFAE